MEKNPKKSFPYDFSRIKNRLRKTSPEERLKHLRSFEKDLERAKVF